MNDDRQQTLHLILLVTLLGATAALDGVAEGLPGRALQAVLLLGVLVMTYRVGTRFFRE